ncbi:little elongation complex subunit 1 [Syngnathoides biaculeatus]|uniref:little elongation complex subunit 1 n=1 Tax=Syngnathoides biaculeatus TaxID=300417 RepID=UPI002ADE32D8|nr:little elongation complex subunit 1 [Syngnathoides biaculeatus]
MMPGDNQPKTVPIASDATPGNCQNCSVLHQSLTEYVSSFLALKQKITVADDTITLRQQHEELQSRLFALEKRTENHEAVQAELEEKKRILRDYGQITEEFEKLKHENGVTLAENGKLEQQLKGIKELMEALSLENAQLKRERAAFENDLLTAQISLKKSQENADKVEKLMEEQERISSMKEKLANKVTLMEESVSERNNQISLLSKEKMVLEKNIFDLQGRLIKLERERNKEYKSIAIQARPSGEHKVDKEKVRILLEQLWACVEPKDQQGTNALLLQDPKSPQRNCIPQGAKSRTPFHQNGDIQRSPTQINAQLKTSPRAHKIKKQASQLIQKEEKSRPTNNNHVTKDVKPKEFVPDTPNMDEILKLFKPLPPCLSPLLESENETESVETGDREAVRVGAPGNPGPGEKEFQDTRTKSPLSPKPLSTTFAESDGLYNVATHEMECTTNIHGSSVTTELENERPSPNADEMQIEEKTLEPLVSFSVSAEESPASTVETELCCTQPRSSCAATNVQETDSCNLTDSQERAQGEPIKDESACPERDLNKMSSGKIRDTLCGKSPKAKVSEEVLDAHSFTSSTCINSVLGKDNLNGPHVSKKKTDDQDSSCLVQEAPDFAALNLPNNAADSEMQDGDVETSSYDFNRSTTTPESEDLKENKGLQAQETVEAERTPPRSDPSRILPPVSTINVADETVADQIACVTTAPQNDLQNDTLNEEKSPSDKCKSLKENSCLLSSHLSHSCSLPNVSTNVSENQTKEEERYLGRNSKHLLMNKTQKVLQNKGLVEGSLIKDLAHDKACDVPTVTAVERVLHGSGQGQSETSVEVLEDQNPDLIMSGVSTAIPATSETAGPIQPLESISKVRTEMGSPLPPLITPVKTPPKSGKAINPRHAIGKLSFPSPMDRLASPCTQVQTPVTPNSQTVCSSSTPNGVPSSPLQFGSATPKHAVPVPGRLPTAVNSSPATASCPSQENSMKILDDMYPELSARARTLSILRGNLSISSSENGASPPRTDSQVSSFTTVTSTGTAFAKTTETRGEKRPAPESPPPKNSKHLRLEERSAGVSQTCPGSLTNSDKDSAWLQTPEVKPMESEDMVVSTETEGPVEENDVGRLLERIEHQAFDVLPVIQSHIHVGNLPKEPVLRDEEKEVISKVFHSSLADEMTLAILHQLKSETRDMCGKYAQALCRVYTAICRQKRDFEKARILAYSLLIEDFPNAAKLILFMVTTWRSLLSHGGLLCQAIHAVAKLKAPHDISKCLSAFLGWEKSPPCDIDRLLSRTLSAMHSGPEVSFLKHSRYGDDLGTAAWEQVFAMHLLCAQKSWKWSYDHILSKELWPLMNTWVCQPRDQQVPIADVTVASVLRLIGLLGQMGIKEKNISSVLTVAKVIGAFVRQSQSEGVPWGVQLAAVNCMFDLSPCDPKEALDALAGWRGEASQSVPSGVTSCIFQLASICRQVKK